VAQLSDCSAYLSTLLEKLIEPSWARFASRGELQILRFAQDDNPVGVISGVICRDPQGLKPASLLALGGTAEAVPFPFVAKGPVCEGDPQMFVMKESEVRGKHLSGV
jgi:hypothetical protein